MALSSTGSKNRLSSISQSVFSIFTLENSTSTSKPRAFLNPNQLNSANRSARSAVTLFYIALALVLLSLFTGSRKSAPTNATRAGVRVGSGASGASSGASSLSRLDRYPNKLVADTPPFQGVSNDRNGARDARTGAGSVAGAGSFTSTNAETVDADVNKTVAPGAKDGDAVARLIVLTMDRSEALQRLLTSAAGADYGGDHVDLDVWVDRRDGAPIDARVLAAAARVHWPHGAKTVYARRKNGGLYQQWIYTWRIAERADEVAIILEDDLELSPAFYQWLKLARSAYAADPEVAAFTLQRSTLRPRLPFGVRSRVLSIPSDQPVFKYRLLGSWGFSPQREAWAEFRTWFEQKRAAGAKPYVDNLITTEWYKSQEKNGFAPSMWTQWWIKFADEKGYFTVTPHLPDGTTLCANWRENGMHYSKGKPERDFPIYTGTHAQFSWPENPMKIDWDGREIKQS